jgi:hypothetical protein
MSLHKSEKGEIEKVLVFYDGPQLLLMKNQHGEHLLGYAVEKDGYDYPIFVVQMLERNLSLYLSGKVDLRYVFKKTPPTRLYFADLARGTKDIKLRRARSSELTDDVFPEAGIFSSTHTHPISNYYSENNEKQRFAIDGVWEARDFSQFHGKMADTYSLLYIAQKLSKEEASSSESEFLRESIADRPWRGGGSYLSFYGGIKDEARSIHPLRVAGIEYHSPGYMDVAGKREVLDEIVEAIEIASHDQQKIRTLYSAIRKALSHEGLLRVGSEHGFSNAAIEDYVKRQSLDLAEAVALPNGNEILKLCSGNVAVFAKLVLSYYRRIRGLAAFFVQGRASIG